MCGLPMSPIGGLSLGPKILGFAAKHNPLSGVGMVAKAVGGKSDKKPKPEESY
jgi:hypothetical protein